MKRPRPHIPLRTRCIVAGRQIGGWLSVEDRVDMESRQAGGIGFARLLTHLLAELAKKLDVEPGTLALDHDPALILRPFDEATGTYTPDANDPDHLVYRTKEDHLRKTVGRAVGAAKTVTTKGSDIWLKNKFDRLEGRTKRRPKAKIPQRKNPWPKRKFGK